MTSQSGVRLGGADLSHDVASTGCVGTDGEKGAGH